MLVFAILFGSIIVGGVLHFITTILYNIWMHFKDKRTPCCLCRTPKRRHIGDVFMCPECARFWSVWVGDWWTHWVPMPYWKRLMWKFGLIRREHIREEDPPPVIEPEPENVGPKWLAIYANFKSRFM